VNARDGFVDHLEAVANDLGLHTRRTPDEPVAVLDLPDSWAAYTRSLSRHSRHELERKRRRAPQAALRSGSPDTDLDHFFALFHRAPGEKGAFLEPAIERFMREAAPATGMLRLDVLEADGRPVAIPLGFQGPRTYYLDNMVHDRPAHDRSPGILLLAALIERAIEEGRERFDFMRGLERYKLELGATPHRLVRLRIAPH
jgi:CelD/BcsL family acetyltransferase involved in cellulose biosynthesis